MKYKIIILNEADISDCADLFCKVYASPPWNNPNASKANAERYFTDCFKNPGFLGFKYLRGGEFAGFVLGKVSDYFFAPQYELIEVLVNPAEHGRGIGTRMLSDAEAELKRRGIAHVFLQTSNKIPAYGFYLKNGYTEVENTVNMAKAL